MRLSKFAVAATLPLALVTCDGPIPHAAPGRRHADAERGPVAPRPPIVTRSAWHADEKLVRSRPSYTGDIRIVFLHHTDEPNTYSCSEVPRMLRSLEVAHLRRGWDDIGYNFIVDHCGTIYEGRAGGVDRPVKGAHTKGFNDHSLGVAALGTYDSGNPVPPKMLASIAALAAWKLRPGIDPRGTVRMTSTNSASRFKKGKTVRLDVISGHRDAYQTSCPGGALYGRLPWLRKDAARLRDTG